MEEKRHKAKEPKPPHLKKRTLMLSAEVADWLTATAKQHQIPAGEIVDQMIRRHVNKFKP
jgi:predicted HicB family RNase H-like nuclease